MSVVNRTRPDRRASRSIRRYQVIRLTLSVLAVATLLAATACGGGAATTEKASRETANEDASAEQTLDSVVTRDSGDRDIAEEEELP